VGFCFEWRDCNEMRVGLICVHFLCNIIMEKCERSLCGCRLSVCLSVSQSIGQTNNTRFAFRSLKA
jgi:hypothetical protein